MLRPDPSWAQYDGAIVNADGVPVRYPLIPEKGFALNFDALRDDIYNFVGAISLKLRRKQKSQRTEGKSDLPGKAAGSDPAPLLLSTFTSLKERIGGEAS